MKKILCTIAAAALILSCFSFALASEQRVFDDAALMSPEQVAALEERIAELRSELDVDIAIHTADSGVYDTADYADTFYENMGFGHGDNRKGVLYFLDMQNRTTYISTAADMIDIIDDSREEAIFDAQMNYLGSGMYYEAFKATLELTQAYVRDGAQQGQYAYSEETGEMLDPEVYGSEYYHDLAVNTFMGYTLLGAVMGTVAGFIAKFSVKKNYSKKYKPVSYDMHANAKLNLMVNDSRLVNKFVTTRIIPRNNNNSPGGGNFGSGSFGSGVHTSSGGMSHGGGGRKF